MVTTQHETAPRKQEEEEETMEMEVEETRITPKVMELQMAPVVTYTQTR